MSRKAHLHAIFDADRSLRTAESQLLEGNPQEVEAELLPLLVEAVSEATAHANLEEASMRLERLADLCSQLHGPEMTDALIAILNHESAVVRGAASEALLEVGYERYAEVARGIERALDAPLSGPAMSELPYFLAEVAEPSALPLLRRFLAHPDADTVAAAIEAIVQLGDPDAVEALQPLCEDARQVALDDLEEETSASVGELAEEAIATLQE